MSEPKKVAIEKREHWGSQVEFFLACLGYAVGTGKLQLQKHQDYLLIIIGVQL